MPDDPTIEKARQPLVALGLALGVYLAIVQSWGWTSPWVLVLSGLWGNRP